LLYSVTHGPAIDITAAPAVRVSLYVGHAAFPDMR
jgi:hypothetical protein